MYCVNSIYSPMPFVTILDLLLFEDENNNGILRRCASPSTRVDFRSQVNGVYRTANARNA